MRLFHVTDLFHALFERHVEVRILDNLLPLRDCVVETDLNWSMCRMKNSKK